MREPHKTLNNHRICDMNGVERVPFRDLPASGMLVYANDLKVFVPVKQLRKEVTRGRCHSVNLRQHTWAS